MSRKPVPGQSKTTLSEKAYIALKQDILRGDVPEGTFLSEGDIRRRHGIGRTPFREACNRLNHEGILEVVPRRGYLVPEMSFRDVRDMFEARTVLEGALAELAALRATPTQVEELERLAKRTAMAGDFNEDYERITKANTEFHLCIARMGQNRELIRVVTGLLEKSHRLLYLELRSGRWNSKDIQNIHKPIVEAIRRQDPVAAREAVVRDIRQGQIDVFSQSQVPNESKPSHVDPAEMARRPRSQA